jgi:hypothetical protein
MPVSGIEHLSEVQCFFAVDQPTMPAVSKILDHDAVVIDEDVMSLAGAYGKLAVLGRLLEAARRREDVERLVAHSGFANLPTAILNQLSVSHCERIRQRRELAGLRGELTTARRGLDVVTGRRDVTDEIDRQILTADGDLKQLLGVASGALGVDLTLEDRSLEATHSSRHPMPASLRSILGGGRIDAVIRDLEPGVPALVRLGQPAAGARLVMRLSVDTSLGYLTVVLDAPRETAAQRIWLERLRPSVVAARHIEVTVSELVRRVGRHILRELVTGTMSPIEARLAAGHIGWIEGRGSSLVAIIFSNRQVGHPERISAVCDRIVQGGFTATVYDEQIVVLCLSADDGARLHELMEVYDDAAFGIGQLDDRVEMAPEALRQASWAARLARSARRRSLHFGEIGIHRLLLPGSEGGDPEFEAPIRRLEEHAGTLGFDPIDTLRVFLDVGASPREAASVLHLHVNTLRYRIERISALAGMDLTDAEQRFQAQLTLRLRSARQAFEVEGRTP